MTSPGRPCNFWGGGKARTNLDAGTPVTRGNNIRMCSKARARGLRGDGGGAPTAVAAELLGADSATYLETRVAPLPRVRRIGERRTRSSRVTSESRGATWTYSTARGRRRTTTCASFFEKHRTRARVENEMSCRVPPALPTSCGFGVGVDGTLVYQARVGLLVMRNRRRWGGH